LHHKVQKFSSGTGSPGWSRKKDRKTVVVWCSFHRLFSGVTSRSAKTLERQSSWIVGAGFCRLDAPLVTQAAF